MMTVGGCELPCKWSSTVWPSKPGKNVVQHGVRSKFAYRPHGLYAVVSDSRSMTEPRRRFVLYLHDR